MTYSLHVTINSNEYPWSDTYTPASWHQPADDAAAIAWAEAMQLGLGQDYACVLKRNGAVVVDAYAAFITRTPNCDRPAEVAASYAASARYDWPPS